MSPSNSCIFLNDEPYGIQLDEQYVLPFSILFPLLINLCIYNGIFICNQLSYDMIEVNEIYKENINYYAIINEKLNLKHIIKCFNLIKMI